MVRKAYFTCTRYGHTQGPSKRAGGLDEDLETGLVLCQDTLVLCSVELWVYLRPGMRSTISWLLTGHLPVQVLLS